MHLTGFSSTIQMPDIAPELLQRFAGLRDMVEVEDVADVIVLLASPARRSYHGACASTGAGSSAD